MFAGNVYGCLLPVMPVSVVVWHSVLGFSEVTFKTFVVVIVLLLVDDAKPVAAVHFTLLV